MGWLDAVFLVYRTVKNAGLSLPQRSATNYIGAVIDDDPLNDQTTITITQSAVGSDLIYRPAGVQTGKVFTNWPDLVAAAIQVQGPKEIFIDCAGIEDDGNAHVPAGVWDLGNNITLLGDIGQCISGQGLTFDDGAQLAQLLYAITDINIVSESSLPIMTLGGGLIGSFIVNGAATISMNSTGNLITGGSRLIFNFTGQTYTNSSGDGFVGSSGVVVVNLYDTPFIQPNQFTGNSLDIQYVSSAAIMDPDQPFDEVNIVLFADAQYQFYTPANSGNWSPQPASTAGALDQLASNLLSGSGVNYTHVHSAYDGLTTALAGTTLLTSAQRNVDVVTSIGVATVQFPASPSFGEVHVLIDEGGSFTLHNLTIDGNGHSVESTAVPGSYASTATSAVNNARLTYVYTGTWDLIAARP